MRGFNTRAVHAGELEDPRFGNVVTPIFQTSTFVQPNSSQEPYLDHATGGPFLYTRWGNPTLQSLEEKYASLEGARHGLSFSSGMAAISAAVLSKVREGDRILSVAELYGQTFHLFSHVLPRYGVKVDFLETDELNKLEVRLKEYKLIYLESITNPLLKVTDVRGISKLASENDVPVVVDATFASPFNQRPLELGAEVVVHSATKYISGHSDVIVGVSGTNSDQTFKDLVGFRKDVGGSPDPHQAYLTLRGMKTIGLRVERQNSNAGKVATLLSQSTKVRKVHYPGLRDSPYREVAAKNLSGFGGMVSFELRDEDCTKRFLKTLTIPRSAPSLGGVESLITRPVETSHSSLTKEEREKQGISESLVRFSAGIEDPEDLLEDFQRALSSC
ncbi:cystathionine beta-lyase [Sulfodiicoccus acidiphilus]|uniref:Cystathionine beta-lyase n=1 Tax=Sulfodiicoccus acidiphilus TaxID=1670455 RepID=A0A348B256_9CREN|nr:PLP-dependent transferase [Sulfodiicoccus acidiphilus]BBD72258.1 cystathionine beta-lyase [Sulfodiicoccus acidiphilus]GGT90728.1 cystathionine beta-lyase [Sulfodiicoccus acidiphilus]